MNVVQVNFAYDPRATDPAALLDRYFTLTDWSEALAAAGAGRVTVIQRFGRDARLLRNGIEYIFYGDGKEGRARPWSLPVALRRAMLDARPDIVHINGLNFPVQTWRLRQILPAATAIVLQDHGGMRFKDGRWPHRLNPLRVVRRRAMESADGFLFVAPEHSAPWQQAGFIQPAQAVYYMLEASTKVTPMPRDTARQVSAMAGTPSVLWIGRLDANKDPLTVLDGFERSLARLPEAALTMIYAGDDLLPAVRERVAASLKLRDRVRLVGFVPHESISAFLSAADVFVLGSHYEAGAYSLVEATACGTPAVVTDIPTFRTIIAEGSLGALWSPGDAAGFAHALIELCAQDLAPLRRRILEHFDRSLSWAVVGRQAMAAYKDALARRLIGGPTLLAR